MNFTPDYDLLHSLLRRPIAFHRVFVTVAGGILPGLMLSQAFYWHPRGSAEDNWFYKTQPEWEAETGMTRWEQETARKKLRQVVSPSGVSLWREERRSVPAKLFYRVDIAALWELLLASSDPAIKNVVSPQSSMLDDNNLEGGDATDKSVAIPHSLYTETTSYNSGQSKKRPPRAQAKSNSFRPPSDIDPLSH